MNSAVALPPDDVGLDFVEDAPGENGGVAGVVFHRLAHCLAGLNPQVARLEETEVLGPGNVDEEPEIELGGKVQQPAGRDVIDPEDVRANLADELEIATALLSGGERFPIRVGAERAVGKAFGVKLFLAEPEEFAIHRDAWKLAGGWGHSFSPV
jgi:hypothetical protein